MKQYVPAKIKRIYLDEEQSVLQVCKVGGYSFIGVSVSCGYIRGIVPAARGRVVDVRGYVRTDFSF